MTGTLMIFMEYFTWLVPFYIVSWNSLHDRYLEDFHGIVYMTGTLKIFME